MAETPNMHWHYPDEYQVDWYDEANGHVQLFNAIDTSMAETLAADAARIPKDIITTKGDLITGTGPTMTFRLPVGANGQVLTANSITALGLEWQTPAVGGTSISSTIVDTKGDLIAGTAPDTVDRFPAGTDGTSLIADSTQPAGLRWGIVSGTGIPYSVVDVKGDLIAADGPDSVVRFPVGADGQVLTASSASLTTGLTWTTPAATPTDLIPKSLLDARGDLITATTNDTPAKLTVGADGHVLTADSAQALGVKWAAAVMTPASGSITDTMLRNSAGVSVIGRAPNSVGVPADIVAGADGNVLRRTGGTLGFGALDLADTDAVTGVLPIGNVAPPAAGTITGAMLRNSVATSVIGNPTGSAAAPADIQATVDGSVLRRVSSTSLGFGTVGTTGIADNAVTDAKLRDSAATSVIGRATTAGDPADIAASLDGQVLRLSGSTLGFGQLNLASSNAVTGVLPVGNLPATAATDDIPKSTLVAKGDLIGATAPSTPGRIGPIGANDTVLTADSTTATGVKWATVPAGTPAADSITNAMLRNSAGFTVIGKPDTGTGDPIDIGPAVDGNVLRRSGATVGFGAVNLAGGTASVTGVLPVLNLPATAATVDIPVSTVTTKGDLIVRDTSAPTRLAVGADATVLTADSTAGGGTVGMKWAAPVAGTPAAGSITSAMLRDSVGLSVIGRSANSTGVPADVVGTLGQVLRIGAGPLLGFGQLDLDSAAAVTGTLGVVNGGTNLAAGTDGGVLAFTGTTTLASSGLLTNNALMLGGGAGLTPKVVASLGTTTTLLHGNAAGAPTFGAVALGTDVSGTLGASNLGIVTTKGDLLGYSTTPARHAVGTNEYTLVSDSTQTTGLRWTPKTRFIGALIADSTTVSNTTVQTTFDKSVTVPANVLTAGSVLRVEYRCLANAATACSAVFLVYLGGSLLKYSDMDWAAAAANVECAGLATITLRTAGSSGTALAHGGYVGSLGATVGYVRAFTTFSGSTIAVNTTTTNAVSVRITMGTANVGNTCKLQCLNVWVDYPESTVS